MKTVNCDYCYKEFKIKPYKLKQKYLFCSRQCYADFRSEFLKGMKSSNWQGGQVLDKCNYCNKELIVPKWKKERKYKFCNKECQYKWMSERFTGEGHPQWIDGRSFEEYPQEFNIELKEEIRKRDNFICQKCGITEEEHIIVYGTVLCVHHIDYDKQNCKKENLTTLCNECNLRVNFNREYWKEYFQERNLKKVKNKEK